MSKLAPFVFWQSFDDDGNPLSGGKVYTYDAGTTTNKETYTDSSESAQNTNPIILDADGRADIWLASGAYKFIIKDANDVLIDEVDNITGDASNVFGSSVVNISTNTNVVSSYENAVLNCTSAVTLSLLDVATAEEGFVFTVKNSSSGNVTVDPDGAELIDGSATLTLYPNQSALIDCTGSAWISLYQDVVALPTANTFTGANTFEGLTTFSEDVVMDAAQLHTAKGADIASATALPLLTDGNFFDVTGTSTITSIDTSGYVGTEIKLQFDGSLILTHHATDLILPSGSNILTKAGDIATFIEYASGDWVCTGYQRASGSTAQVVSVFNGSVATGTTTIPYDDTIPQITEGDEYMTLAITPKSATSKLVIKVVFNYSQTGAATATTLALFQDSTANALAATGQTVDATTYLHQLVLEYTMTSGTTSETTFRVRAGDSASETLTFNGVSGARKYGGVMASSITITEVL